MSSTPRYKLPPLSEVLKSVEASWKAAAAVGTMPESLEKSLKDAKREWNYMMGLDADKLAVYVEEKRAGQAPMLNALKEELDKACAAGRAGKLPEYYADLERRRNEVDREAKRLSKG